ncbi:MAG: TolC family protein [Chlorobiaceae bacterium]|nr:TolC family protein [Chlorobiaceae bacterium]
MTKDRPNRKPLIVKKSVLILAVLLFLLPHNSRAIEQPTKTLSLRECVSIALKNATAVKKAENNQQLEGADLLRSYGSFLPRVTSSSSYVPRSVNRAYSPLSTGTLIPVDEATIKTRTQTASLNFSVTASLNLFNGFSDYAGLQSALDMKHASGFTLRRAKEAVVYDVTQSYYQVLLNQELLGIARENLQSARDLLTLTDRQFNIGLKSVTDLYQQQAEVSNNELSAIRADNQLRRSKFELLRRLRLDPRTDLSLEPVDTKSFAAFTPELNIDDYATSSISNRADLKAKALERDGARWDVRRAAGNFLPKLDLAFTTSTSAIDSYRMSALGMSYEYPYPSVNRQLRNGMDYSVSLNLSWTIFDGFQTRYNVETARIAHINRQLDYEELKDAIVIDLQQVAGDYRAAFSQIDSAKTNLKASESAFAGVLRKYELEASGFVELSVSRAALFNARSSMTQASYNLALQKALLDFTAGRTTIE